MDWIAVAEDLSAEETEIYEELAERAGAVAHRLLSEQGVAYLDDLHPEAARALLRKAWRAAARDRFGDLDISELYAEIDAMLDSVVMTSPPKDEPTLILH